MKRSHVASRELWKEVFGDDDAFLDLYFSEVFSEKDTLSLYHFATGKAIARVDLLPFVFHWHDTSLKAYYISGAATAKEARGEGRMTQLLQVAHHEMRRRGAVLSFLIPQEASLYGYYRRVASYFPIASAKTITFDKVSFTSPSTALFLRDKKWRRQHLYGGYICHTYPQWLAAYHNASLYGGGAMETEDLGLLFVEKVAQHPAKWATHVPANTISSAQGTLSQSYPHGMARIIHLPRLMQRYARMHPTFSWKFDCIDDAIVPNSGRYFLHKGRLLFYHFLPKQGSLPRFSPSELGQRLLAEDSFFFDRLMAPIALDSE